MIWSADQSIYCKMVHELNVILIDAVLLMDGVGIHQIIVHVAVVLIPEDKVNSNTFQVQMVVAYHVLWIIELWDESHDSTYFNMKTFFFLQNLAF